ncbi:MAG TPA: serine/threonine-protein kinase, partial [Acidimicrobiales bacterium]
MTTLDLDIPGYSRLAEVDRGGFATIYRAWQPTFEREVAVKVLSGRIDETALRSFRRECSAIGGLSGHPNIVTVYEAGTSGDGRPFIVMEYLHGGSLAHRLAEHGPLEVADVLRLGVLVAGALESAHRAGILHRDLKPENILLSRLGEPKVADFGLAQLPGGTSATSAGLVGTVLHAAPEVLAGEAPTVASDVYSLASTLFSLVAGRPPFALLADNSLMGTMARIACEPPPDLRFQEVPDQLCRILEQGLAKAPADRQRDMAQLGRQLLAAQAELGHAITPLPIESADPTSTAAVDGDSRTPRVRTGRRGLRLVVAAMLAVAAVGLSMAT